MRILLVTDGIYPFVMGGMQKHSYYLGKFLSRMGVQVHLVHCADGIKPGQEWDRPEFSDADAGNISFRSVPFPSMDRLPGHYLRESKRYSEDVLKAVKPDLQHYDLVYCQGFTAWAFIEAKERGEHDIPVVSNLHGYEMFQQAPTWKERLGRWPLRRIAERVSLGSNAVFSFGGHITDILLKMGVPAANILECPIGIEKRWLVDAVATPERSERVFVFVGRDERRKGVHELSMALKAMNLESNNGFLFHFIGPIAEANKVNAENIVYHGPVKEEGRVMEILRSADVLVCASYAEGMPTVIMEAMASGLAIIGTDVGAVSQQVGENGWLIAAPRVEDIRSALEQAVRIPADELTAMKRDSLAKVRERFTWEHVIQRKLELLTAFRKSRS